MIGARLEAGGKFFYDRGRYFDLSLNAGASKGVRHGFVQYGTGIDFCSKNHIAGYSYLDLCYEERRSNKDLSRSKEARKTAEFTQIVGTQRPTELRFRSFEVRNNDGQYHGYGFSVLTTLNERFGLITNWDRVLISDGNAGTSSKVSVTLATKVADHPIQIGVSRSEYQGTPILGLARNDVTDAVQISWTATPRVSVTASYALKSSTIDFYSDKEVGFSINFASF